MTTRCCARGDTLAGKFPFRRSCFQNAASFANLTATRLAPFFSIWTIPGLSLKAAREAFRHCMECLKKIAADFGYHTMAAFTYPGISRYLERNGFSKAESNLVQMFAPTKEVSNG
jgi:hypothetical protein